MRLIVTLILLSSIGSGIAAEAKLDLYRGEVPVEDQSQAAREAAFPAALSQVLAKLSGLRELDEYPAVHEATRDARSLVLSFYYEQREAEEVLPDSEFSNGEARQPQNYLVVRFSSPGVNELMRLLALPRWPTDRDPLTIWVLIDDGLSRRVLPLEYAYLRAPMERVAESRGLPLDWPEAGPEGDYGVDIQLLWGGYTDSIASDGQAGDVLVVAARREGPEWNTRQVLEFGEQHWSWRNRDIDLGRALTEAMHQTADQIAAVQAIAAVDQGSWIHEIVISGLKSGEDYQRCLSYLESLAVVDEVAVRSATPGGVSMSLKLNASPQYFEQALAEEGVLEYAELSGQYVLQP